MESITSFENPILRSAEEVLAGESFAVDRVELAAQAQSVGIRQRETSELHFESLLAEDPYFVLLILAAPTLEELQIMESSASNYLAARLSEQPMGDKTWDGYVLLLAGERLADLDDTTVVYDLVYDVSNVRRMVALGVRPHSSSIRHALRPFLRLRRLEVREVLTDVFDDLVDALSTEGIDRDAAEAAVDHFRRQVAQ